MSRKNILTPSSGSADVAIEPRSAKIHSQPLLGVTRPDRHPSKRLTGDIGSVFRESSERSQRAEDIERRLAEGQTVVSLAVSEIEPSFISDRMPGSAEDHNSLVASIREQGQQVPILVRPHPSEPGRYQLAFGHRRLRALTDLGRPVSAVVRDLTDEQLVVAQGQENNERQDLTYIEKARFAQRLSGGFSRETIMASLSIDKSAVSRLLATVSDLPIEIIDAIGAAPGVGRGNWEALAVLMGKEKNVLSALDFVRAPETQRLGSAERFKALMAHLKPKKLVRGLPGVWRTDAGEQLAKIAESKTKVDISIDRREAPEFAAFMLEKVQSLFEEYRSKGWRSGSMENGE